MQPLALLYVASHLPLYPVLLSQHLLVPLVALTFLHFILSPEGVQLLFEAGNDLVLVSVESAILILGVLKGLGELELKVVQGPMQLVFLSEGHMQLVR